MAETLLDADNLLVVSDADGMLLSIAGDTRLRNRAADDMNFVEGALWSESSAGTNAIGTAVAAAHAVQVFAAEHFTEPVQRWTCSAAPVIDPDTGEVIGDHRPHRRHQRRQPAQPRGRRGDRARRRGGAARPAARARRAPARALRPARSGRPRPARALVTGTGRILLDPGQRWGTRRAQGDPRRRRAARAAVRRRGDRRADRRRRRLRRAPQQPARRGRRARASSCGCSATSRREVTPRRRRRCACARATSRCSRSSRCIAATSTPTSCAPSSTATTAIPASVRVEMSRLRRLLPGALDAGGYAARRRRSPATSATCARCWTAAPCARRPRPTRARCCRGSVAPVHRARARRARRLDAPGRHHLRRRRRAVGVGALVVGRQRPARLDAAARRARLHRSAPQPRGRADRARCAEELGL